MTDNKTLMQQALDALIPLSNAHFPDERECLTDEDVRQTWLATEALRKAIAQPEQTAEAWHPTQSAIAALKRFQETCSDGEGYDLPKDTMHQLAGIGLIYKNRGSTYCITDFGNSVLASAIAQPVPLPVLHTRKAELVWAIAQDKWNALADKGNQWNALGQDEMSLLIVRETELQLSQAIAQPVQTAPQSAQPDQASEIAALRRDAERYRWLRSIGHDQTNVLGHYAGDAMDVAIDAAIAQPVQQLASKPAMQVHEQPYAPDYCPITGRKFWGNIEHNKLGVVATYGGPFDTYTIPARTNEGELRSERFDQDRGDWVDSESVGWIYDDQQDQQDQQNQQEAAQPVQLAISDEAIKKEWLNVGSLTEWDDIGITIQHVVRKCIDTAQQTQSANVLVGLQHQQAISRQESETEASDPLVESAEAPRG